MIYAILSIVLFGIFIVLKEKGTTRYFFFLLILGWVASIVGYCNYLLYLHKHNLYLFMFSKVLGPTLSSWGNMELININIFTSITLINFGTVCFVYSCICFAISIAKTGKAGFRTYILLAIIPVIEIIIYNPYAYSAFYNWYFKDKDLLSPSFQMLLDIELYVYFIILVINYIYLTVSIAIIIVYYIKTPAMKYFKNYILTILLGFSTNIITFITVFWWSPKRLISVSVFTGYTHILPVSLFWEGKILFLFPYISVLSCILIIIALIRYNNDYQDMKQNSTLIVKAFDTAGLGTRLIAHNFKNYIMATLVDAEFIQEKLQNDPVTLEYINRIVNLNYEFMDRISHLSGKFKSISLHLQPYDIKTVLEDTLLKINLQNVVTDIDIPSEPIKALIDSKYIGEVFYNIIKNAIDAMEYTDKKLTIKLYAQGRKVIVTFTDTGCGMSPEQVENIFTPFYSTKSELKNWGIGLTYCFKIVNAHKGKIHVESKPDFGTTFKVILQRVY